MSSGFTSFHADGTPCPEGSQKLPKDGHVCCEDFAERTRACFFDIRYEYWTQPPGWFVIIQPDAGGGGVAMNYCPHCGEKLPGKQLSGRYMNPEDF